MCKRHLILLALVLITAVACSSPTIPAGTGPQTSGSPPPESGGTSTSGPSSDSSSSSSSSDEDETALPTDVTQPPTVTPPPQSPPPSPQPQPSPPPSSPPPPVCGNGTVETGEQCDDGNILGWDGCTGTCQTEATPTVIDNFASTATTLWNTKYPHGALTFAVADNLASDQKVAKLSFSGGQTNAVGPVNATQISTKFLLGFGMYRARVNFAKCAPIEELVNGIFTYSYGGTGGLPLDSNKNGITDNNEIDFEVLCGEPRYLWMTSWTDYTNDSSLRKVSRLIDTATGNVYQTVPGKEGQYGIGNTVIETIPEMKIPDFATTEEYYEIGFDWKSASLRFFMMRNGKEITLWTLDDTTYLNGASYIPQNKAFMMFNLWHPKTHWYVGGDAAYPAVAQSLKVDWFKHWAQ